MGVSQKNIQLTIMNDQKDDGFIGHHSGVLGGVRHTLLERVQGELLRATNEAKRRTGEYLNDGMGKVADEVKARGVEMVQGFNQNAQDSIKNTVVR